MTSKTRSLIIIYSITAAIVVAWVIIAPKIISGNRTEVADTARTPRPVPDFTLTDHRGQAVSRTDLLGKVWVANFIFSSCPGACLDMTKRMREIEQSLPDRENLRLVTFSIDPKNDTPAVLATYAERNSAGPRWSFLTGDRAVTARVANEGFQFPLSTDAASFEHSEQVAVVDSRGTVRGWFDSHSPTLVKDVGNLVRTL